MVLDRVALVSARVVAQAVVMAGYASTASFMADDVTTLVDAALACPWCLSGHVEWRLELADHDDRAVLRCSECGEVSLLYLSSFQALRLAVEAPEHVGS